MIHKFFILIFSVSSITAIAQSNFEAALVINNAGDTLTGFIDNRAWQKNPKLISYKSAEGQVTKYSPLDIQEFYLTNTKEKYKSAVIELNKNSLKESDVINIRNQKGTHLDTVFLQLLVKGRVSLYYLNDESSRPHFIVEKDKVTKELKMERKRVSYPKQGVVNLEYYKAQLSAYFADCTSGEFPVSKAKYTEASLTSLIVKYNQCFPADDIYVKATEKTKADISVIAGANYSKLNVAGDAYALTGKNHKGDITPFAGISFDLIFPKNRKSWSLNNDLIYRYYSIEGVFEANQIKLLTTLRYRFPSTTSSRFFLGGGFTNALALSAQALPEGTSWDFRKHEQGLTLETGIIAKRLTYLLRYERSNGFSSYSTTNTKFTVLYAGMAFRLN